MKRLIALVFTLLPVTVLFADGEQFSFGFAPRIFGVTVTGEYAFSEPTIVDVETSIVATLSAAYEAYAYYRLPDGSLFTAGDLGYAAESASINRLNFLWELGLQQGILPRGDMATDRAQVYALYRGQFDHPFERSDALFSVSGLPEASGGLVGSTILGLRYSDVTVQPVTHSQRGLFGEVSLEWAPEFLHNRVLGSADYTRTTLTAGAFVPIAEAEPRDGMNRFASYVGVMGVVDWAYGSQIPFNVRSTTGGRHLRDALGGSVRGLENLRLDASLKAILNLDVRLNLPAIALPTIIPGIVIYTDLGYYNDLEAVSPVADENSGTVVSSGAGISLDLLNAAVLVFYTNFLWNETDIDGGRWVPFYLGFGYHF